MTHLTMRLSDAGLRRRATKLIYPNHRLPPGPNEDDTRDRSNRLLGGAHEGATIPRACDTWGNSPEPPKETPLRRIEEIPPSRRSEDIACVSQTTSPRQQVTEVGI